MMEMEVLRDRNVLYRTNLAGMVENVYTLKIANKEPGQRQVTVSVSGISGLSLEGSASFTINGGEVVGQVVKLLAPADKLNSANEEILFSIVSDNPDQPPITSRSRFMSPD